MIRAFLLASLATVAGAAEADEILAQIHESLPVDVREAPRNPARAEAIRDVIAAEGAALAAPTLLRLQLALAGAWVEAGDPAQSEATARAVIADPAASPDLREAAGLLLVAARRERLRSATAAALVAEPLAPAVEALGLSPRTIAYALVADAQADLDRVDQAVQAARAAEQEDPPADPAQATRILATIDRALTLLAKAPPDERTPLYALRVDAMERLESDADAISAWLLEHQADPAAALVVETALSQGQRLVGRRAPELAGPRADGAGGQIDLAALAGRPVVVAFLATWSAPCDAVATALVRIQAEHPEAAVLAVSLDRPETLPRLPGWLQRFGATFPVIGDGLGWDSERDDAWGVDAIPSVFVVAADGTLRARDLVGRDAETTRRAIAKVLSAAVLEAPGTFVP